MFRYLKSQRKDHMSTVWDLKNKKKGKNMKRKKKKMANRTFTMFINSRIRLSSKREEITMKMVDMVGIKDRHTDMELLYHNRIEICLIIDDYITLNHISF
jgi:hypothetical protein